VELSLRLISNADTVMNVKRKATHRASLISTHLSQSTMAL